ncbi:hypothetical protein CQW23_14351 [Capsicum baccatum]|uniref:Ubiquitin-like protease family profile domain-containing protein n=1 Tax=Capsicum baccatum TaxID=33114 RepID=A0A2G2WIX5_CAPBA|nr:hypothetical protein CQW23_14351 [Capsicum baccatum]
MQGLCISVGISWHLIDEVYVTVNCKGSLDWIVVVIVLKERCIRVYDSFKGYKGHVDEIKEFAKILSTYLTIFNFFGKNKECTDRSLLEAYKEKTDQHAFDVQFVDGIVQQSSGMDRGLFVASYAEYLSDRNQIPSSEFDPEKHRTRYASLLWDYGVNKACNGYVRDNHDPPGPKCIFIPSEDTKTIDVEP